MLSGQCVEPGAEGLPFAPLVDVLRTLARTMPPDQLGRVLGRLSAVRPVLLALEDVHWADGSTLDLAAFLIRSLPADRVLLVITYRSDELNRHHPLRPLLPAGETTRAHAVVLMALATAYGRANASAEAGEAAQQTVDDARDAAQRAVAAARAADAPDVEAEAALSLGLFRFMLHPSEPDAGLETLRAGLRLALDMDIPFAAVRGYGNLSDSLHALGRYGWRAICGTLMWDPPRNDPAGRCLCVL